jgi:cysteine desulfurase/selenocysteine lyase
MVSSVSFEKATWQKPPYKFEAGTPDVAGAIGLGAAVDYLESLGRARVSEHERGVLEYARALLKDVPGLRLLGDARERTAVLSFSIEGVHPHDAGTILDLEGVAVRSGHLCAQPLLRRLGVTATVRASFAVYNRRADADALLAGVRKVRETLA